MKKHVLCALAIALSGSSLSLGCADEAFTLAPTPLCRCSTSEICVAQQCVPIRDAQILDPPVDPGPAGPVCEASLIRIEEIRHAGTSAPDFIELSGPASASLDGYRLLATAASGARVVDVYLSGQLSPGGLWLGALGDGLEVPPDAVVSGVGFSSMSGSVQLFDCDARLLDAVGYGTFSTDDRFRGEGTPAEAAAPGDSLGRCVDGTDTDDNKTDFHSAAATPGFANTTLAGVQGCTSCDATNLEGAVWIGELLYDPTGADEDNIAPAFAELQGTPDTALIDVWIESYDDSAGRWRQLSRLSGNIGANGRYLIAETSLSSAQLVLDSIDLPNDAGGLRLTSCGGLVLDAVGYGTLSDLAAAGLTSAETDVPEEQTLSRCPDRSRDGAFQQSTATPGIENACSNTNQPCALPGRQCE